VRYIQGIQHAFTKHWKTFGIKKTIKAAYLYHIILIKRIFLGNQEDVITVNGYQMHVIPKDKGISEELYMFKMHEPLNTKYLANELKKGMVCLDVGANIGYFAFLESQKIGETGRVIAVEPAPTTFELFKKNINLQKIQNIDAYNFAFNNIEGSVDFFVSSSSNWSRIIGYKNTNHEDIGKTIKIVAHTIDNFLEEIKIKRLDLIRIDLEGYEFEIFEGAKKTLEKLKPMLQIEVHRDFMGLEKTLIFLKNLRDIGYEIIYYIPRGVDMPIVASLIDVKKIKIDFIIENIQKDPQMEYFSILLKNKLL
jgi:FkbM family methyltransferase